jgi:hypothetical protein
MWAMTASTPGTLTERWLQSVRKWITEGAVSLRADVWPGCNSKLSVRLVFTSLIGARWGEQSSCACGNIGSTMTWPQWHSCSSGGGGSPRPGSYLAACSPKDKKPFARYYSRATASASASENDPLRRAVWFGQCRRFASAPGRQFFMDWPDDRITGRPRNSAPRPCAIVDKATAIRGRH